MDIAFCEITRENWRACVGLTVGEDQRNFVAPNMFSLAQSKYEPEMRPLMLMADGEPAGFAMHSRDPETGRVWLMRFMIDHRLQGKGLGRAALALLLKLMRDEYGRESIYLSYNPQNTVAERLYESFGFKKTGEVIYGETVSALAPAP